jgi:RNA-binding protein 25
LWLVFVFLSFPFGWIQQERLRHWESRERKKLRDYDKLELKEKERIEEQQKQAVWLKQFLEDYDDERDDSKYYK